jgi:uncharacterized protein
MQRDQIIKRLLNAKPMFEEHGVLHLAIFGSQARGDGHQGSDLDLLLDVPSNPNFSLLELALIEQMTESHIGLPTNAFLKRSLNPAFEATIAPDLVAIF